MNGRLRLRQPRKGFRFGTASMLLGAAIRSQGKIADFGCGAGNASLWALKRNKVDTLLIDGYDCNQEMVSLSQYNSRQNGLESYFCSFCCDITLQDWEAKKYDMVVMNPPFYALQDGQKAKSIQKARAHHAEQGLDLWMKAAKQVLHPGAEMLLIFPAWRLSVLGLYAAKLDFGDLRLRPVYGRCGKPAIFCLASFRKNRVGESRILPSLVLRDEYGKDPQSNGYSKAVLALLQGDPLPSR